MVTGDCRIWSWTLVTFVIICTILYIMGFVSMIFKMKQQPSEFIQKNEEDV